MSLSSLRPFIGVKIPGFLPSVANRRTHPMALAKIKASQRNAVEAVWPSWGRGVLTGVRVWHVVVTLTHGAPWELDDDNLRTAFKACRDEVTRLLGLKTDREVRLSWIYAAQVRTSRAESFHAIDVEIDTPEPLLPVALPPRAARAKKKSKRFAAASPNTYPPRGEKR